MYRDHGLSLSIEFVSDSGDRTNLHLMFISYKLLMFISHIRSKRQPVTRMRNKKQLGISIRSKKQHVTSMSRAIWHTSHGMKQPVTSMKNKKQLVISIISKKQPATSMSRAVWHTSHGMKQPVTSMTSKKQLVISIISKKQYRFFSFSSPLHSCCIFFRSQMAIALSCCSCCNVFNFCTCFSVFWITFLLFSLFPRITGGNSQNRPLPTTTTLQQQHTGLLLP